VTDRLPLLDARKVPILAFAPRIDSRLLAALAELDDREVPIAETYRRLTRVARHLQLFRPSYEQIRKLVHILRRVKRFPTAGEILLDVAFRTRPVTAIGDFLTGTLPPKPPP
jgi:hypothetical protein